MRLWLEATFNNLHKAMLHVGQGVLFPPIEPSDRERSSICNLDIDVVGGTQSLNENRVLFAAIELNVGLICVHLVNNVLAGDFLNFLREKLEIKAFKVIYLRLCPGQALLNLACPRWVVKAPRYNIF